ncbi:MAG: hypothetical protein ACP5N3_02195 [Candidatus Nanoarchaeia archaeon]
MIDIKLETNKKNLLSAVESTLPFHIAANLTNYLQIYKQFNEPIPQNKGKARPKEKIFAEYQKALAEDSPLQYLLKNEMGLNLDSTDQLHLAAFELASKYDTLCSLENKIAFVDQTAKDFPSAYERTNYKNAEIYAKIMKDSLQYYFPGHFNPDHENLEGLTPLQIQHTYNDHFKFYNEKWNKLQNERTETRKEFKAILASIENLRSNLD